MINNYQNKKNLRFGFGNNWKNYIKNINDKNINDTINSLSTMLEVDSLEKKEFIDIGSGSGIFSLAARRLGAKVTSFDYDQNSVECTKKLKDRFFRNDTNWNIFKGSILDKQFLYKLEKFDIVYSWGVLHHTGSMWKAIDNASSLVNNNGSLYIAIYNDQLLISKYWLIIKRLYNLNKIVRYLIIILHLPYFILLRKIIRTITSRKLERGMSLWHDMLDWLGGYPFEVAKPSEIVKKLESEGFVLKKQILVGNRQGCNEFIFQRK